MTDVATNTQTQLTGQRINLGCQKISIIGQGVRSSDFDEESNKQGEFLFNCKDGLNWWFNVADVKYANAGVQVDPVANSSGSKMTVDFVPKSEETVSETYLLTFLGLKWLWGQYIY